MVTAAEVAKSVECPETVQRLADRFIETCCLCGGGAFGSSLEKSWLKQFRGKTRMPITKVVRYRTFAAQ